MTARSKRGRRKKGTPAQQPAQHAEKAGTSAKKTETQKREPDPSPKASLGHSRQVSTKRQGGKVHKNALYLTAVLSLLLGIYLGTLLPALRGFKDLASHVQLSCQMGHDRFELLRELEKTVMKNPQDKYAWIQLGNLFFDDNMPREAIRAYEHALAVRSDNPDVLTDMGIMYRQLGEFERAAQIFAQAFAANPLHEQSRFNLGVVLFFDLDRKDEARKAWRELLDINPEMKTPDGLLLRIILDELA
jgi:cytochrome c-type biogenesis protein CcmH/NrfG